VEPNRPSFQENIHPQQQFFSLLSAQVGQEGEKHDEKFTQKLPDQLKNGSTHMQG